MAARPVRRPDHDETTTILRDEPGPIMPNLTIRHRGEDVWHDIDSEIKCRDSAGSNRAAARLADLKHLAAEQGIATDFSLRFAAIREHPARKRQFIARLDAL